MSFWHVIVLAVVQGLAELLPVSSSAHVVVAEKLMGMDPSAPEMTLLLVMLHTGTMFAVIVYFWKQWVRTDFRSFDTFKAFAARVIVATALTGLIGEGLVKFIEHVAMRGMPHAEVEQLFGRLELIAPALAAAGVLIVIAAGGLLNQQRLGDRVSLLLPLDFPLTGGDFVEGSPFRLHPNVGIAREDGARDVSRQCS